MAAEEQTEPGTEKKSGSMKKIVIWLVVVTVSIGGGFATPLLIAKLNSPVDQSALSESEVPDPEDEVEFIDFDEIVAVLGKSKFSKYLKINLSLQVAKSQRLDIEKKIEARTAVIKNRIIAHVAEISSEDIEGKFGHNQLRRELHGFFNEILFDDGIERVQDVLFRELQVN
jgi:flagellar basal body-associated protein FliL